MAAIGWAVLPITPSIRGLGSELDKELMGPARRAAKSAGADIQKSLADATKSAAAEVEKAIGREKSAIESLKSAEAALARSRNAETRAFQSAKSAELKLSVAQEKAARDVSAAEKALADARKSGDTAAIADAESRLAEVRSRTDATVIDRENALSRARDSVERATEKVASAESKVSAAKDKSAEASENAIAATKRLDSAQGMTTDEFEASREELKRFQAELGRTSDEMLDTASDSETLGSKIRSGLGKIGTGALLGVGAKLGSTVVSGFGTAISSGMDRLKAIDQAKASLSGLGHSAETVSQIMDNAMESVKGTAFGFGDAAGLAGTLVASGIEPGQELERVLSLVGDSAAITGSDLTEMGGIWAKVAANGKLSSQELNQFLDRNLGLLPAIAEEFGVTNEEARKLVSEGKIGFEEFSAVMENMVGGAAVEMGDTFTGSFDNMKAALGRFGAQLLEPVFENAPAIFAAVSEAVDALGERFGPVIADLSERLSPAVSDFASNLGPALASTIGTIADVFATAATAVGDFVGWVRDNETWLVPLAAGLGTVATAFKLLSVYMKAVAAVKAAGGIMALVKATTAWSTITKIQAGAQAALNLVMNANPIFLIITALVALGVALWAFFTKTETGRELWGKLTDAFSTGWEAVKSAFAAAWDFISPIFDWIGEAFSKVGEVIGTAWEFMSGVFSTMMDVFKVVAAVFMAVLITPWIIAWNLLSEAVTWAWETILAPTWEAIQIGLDALGMAFVWVWETLIKPAWDALGAGIAWVWETLIRPTWDALRLALDFVGMAFVWVWESVIKPAWDALGMGIAWVWESIIRPAWDALKAALSAVGSFFQMIWNSVIKPVWDALGAGIRAVIDSVIMPAWDGLKAGLSAVGDFFSEVVEGIKRTWDKLKGYVAAPINWVINTAWNDGLAAAWDIIAGFLPGLPPAKRVSPIAFADGGEVPFTSGAKRGQDSVRALLMPNEHVLDVGDVKGLGGHGNIYALRAFVESGRPFLFDGAGGLAGLPRNPDHRAGDLAGAAPDLLIPRFRDGGAVRRQIDRDKSVRPAWMDQVKRGHEFASRVAPGPYLMGASTGGVPGGASDCSGFMSEIGDVILGGPGGTRQWATGSFPGPQAGAWASGLGEGFSVGIVHGGPGGGHTAGTLTGVDQYATTNVESGGGTGQGATYGGPAAGADSGILPEKWHLAIGADGAFQSAGGPSPEQQRSFLRDKVHEVIDTILGPIRAAVSGAVGDPPPEWLGIPPVAIDETTDAAVDTAFDFIEEMGDKLRSAYDLAKGLVGSLFDTGGVLPPGLTMAVNATGADEYVLTGGQWANIARLVKSLGVLTPELERMVDEFDGDAVVDEFVRRAHEVAEEMRPEWEAAIEKIGPSIAKSVGNDVADFFGFKGVVDSLVKIGDELTPKTDAAAASTVAPVRPEPTVEVASVDPAADAAAKGEDSDREVKREDGPLVVIENVYANNDDDVVESGLRAAKRAVRSSALAGGWRV